MFSVLIATYNGEKYILEQLESVVSQTVPPDTIYIYDDCSTDNTIKLISDWKKRNTVKNVIVRKNSENKGYTRNFLEALFEIDDEFIFLCDQDDVWKKDKIESYRSFLDGQSDKHLPLLVTSGYSVTDENLHVVREQHVSAGSTHRVALKSFLKDCSYPGMTFCVNRALKEKAKELFSVENIAFHDYFLSLVALKYGQLFCIQKNLVLYRQHGNNQLGVSGKRNKNRHYWEKVLRQKCAENQIATFLFPDDEFISRKTEFSEKRLENFRRGKCRLFSVFEYIRFYGLKSFFADFYYTKILRGAQDESLTNN